MHHDKALSPPREATLVLGMHRCGTSALTRLVGLLGAALPADPNPPAADNPEGYWEPARLVAEHDALLAVADSAWFDTRPLSLGVIPPEQLASLIARMAEALRHSFNAAPHVVVKDPRICRFLPLLRGVLTGLGLRPSVVLALRPPAEVAASLAVRDNLSPAYAGILWARHLIEAERDSRDLPRAVVTYSDLLDDWRRVAVRIAGLPGTWAIPERLASPVRPDLRHHRDLHATAVFGDPLGAALHELYEAITALAEQDGALQRAQVDAAAAPVLAAARQMAASLEAEFLVQRLTSPHPHIASSDAAADRERFAAAMQQLHLRQATRPAP